MTSESSAESKELPARKPKNHFVTLLKLVFSISLISWLLTSTDIKQIFTSMSDVNVTYLIFAVGLQFVGSFLTVLRWQLLLAAQGVPSKVRFLFGSWLTACFFNQFSPSTVGGDSIRLYDSWRLGASKSVALAIVGVDRLIGLMVLVLLAVVALFFTNALTEKFPMLSVSVIFGALGLMLCTWWIFSPSLKAKTFIETIIQRMPGKLNRILMKFHSALMLFNGRNVVLGKSLLISILLQINVVSFYYLIGLSMGFTIAFTSFLLMIPVATFVLLLPVSINGIGLREAVFVFLLASFGIASEVAIAFSWLVFGLFLAYGLLGGVVYYFRKNTDRINTETA